MSEPSGYVAESSRRERTPEDVLLSRLLDQLDRSERTLLALTGTVDAHAYACRAMAELTDIFLAKIKYDAERERSGADALLGILSAAGGRLG